MGTDGKKVIGTLIVRNALHQTSEEDEAAGEWVTKTHSASFVIEGREFAGIPRPGEKVNIGPTEAPLDYWAVAAEVEQKPDGSIEVTAELDVEAQRADVEVNEVSDEYEVLTFYGHATQIDEALLDERRVPLSHLEDGGETGN
jgi:hypothetical protein